MTEPYRAFKSLLLVLLYSCCNINAEIRCYCNESKCVTSSYMCKSQLGMCYLLVKVNEGVKSIVSGCADFLQEEPEISTCAGRGAERNVAEVIVNETDVIKEGNGVELKETTVIESVKEGDNVKSNTVDAPRTGLICCTQDMCNYRDSNEITITIDTKTHTVRGDSEITLRRTDENSKSQKDLWFKAAVIAVPIAGGFILILLVLLAVRMLRTDSRHHKRLIQIRRERSLTKAQLYVTDHFNDKDNIVRNCHADKDSGVRNSNEAPNHVKNKTVHHSQSSKREHNHSHRNSSNSCQSCRHHHHHHKQCQPKLTTCRDGYTYEQIVTQNSEANASPCEHTCHNARTSPCSSVIVWGKSKQTDSADVV